MNIICGVGSGCLTSSLCFIGGYTLNKASLEINKLAVKYLGLPIDMFNHQEYAEYSNTLVEANRASAKRMGIGLDRILGAYLSIYTIAAIREEISYRFLLENMILSRICSHPLEPIGISSLLFAARHLTNPGHSSEILAAQFLHTALLGVVCSLVQSHIGLVGAMFVHFGFNMHAYKYMFNQSLSETVKNLKAIRREDVILHIKSQADIWVCDVRSPLILIDRARQWSHRAGDWTVDALQRKWTKLNRAA